MAKRFLNGILNLFLPVRDLALVWDLSLVLSKLMAAPFEPMATCSLSYLFMKEAFILAVTSIRRVGELIDLMAEPPHIVIHKHKISMRLHGFLLKVLSKFHIN